MEVIGGFFVLLSLVLFAASFVGLFKPLWFNQTKRWKAFAKLMGASFLVGIFAGALLPEPDADDSDPVQTTPAPTTRSSRPSVGENAVMANEAMLAVDDEAWDAMTDGLLANDTIGLTSLLLSGDAFFLDEGTRVLVLDQGFFSTRVRALEGDNMGKQDGFHSSLLRTDLGYKISETNKALLSARSLRGSFAHRSLTAQARPFGSPIRIPKPRRVCLEVIHFTSKNRTTRCRPALARGGSDPPRSTGSDPNMLWLVRFSIDRNPPVRIGDPMRPFRINDLLRRQRPRVG